jgi:TPR repeat protein
VGGIQKNDTKAIYWIERSARFSKKLNPATQELAIGKSYATGDDGVKQDTSESIKWLRLSAEKGNKEAAALLENSHPAPQYSAPPQQSQQ